MEFRHDVPHHEILLHGVLLLESHHGALRHETLLRDVLPHDSLRHEILHHDVLLLESHRDALHYGVPQLEPHRDAPQQTLGLLLFSPQRLERLILLVFLRVVE